MPFGVITNGKPHKREIMRALGLDALTTCLYVSEVFGREKPDPTIFKSAARCLRISPKRVLFVGDEAHKDVWGAERVGMRSALLKRRQLLRLPRPRKQPTPRADLIIRSLDELRDALGLAVDSGAPESGELLA